MDLSQQQTKLEPSILIIFGVTGDLAQRKVLPALYQLFAAELVNDQTYVVGTSRREVDISNIVDHIKSTIPDCNPNVLERIRSKFSMLQLNPTDDADYVNLRTHLQTIEDKAGVCLHRLFYLSIPPQVYGGIVHRLGQHGLNEGCIHGSTSSRLLVEKPFGYDLVSAQELIAKTAEYFTEEQVFRIDHYLAKETAQNILVFRKNNALFNQIWSRDNISRISISAVEKIGIEGRANFYENVGALRDLIQSHLMQLLSLILMQIPDEITANNVHAAKQRVLDNIASIPANEVHERAVRGQYDTYKAEVHNDHSATETYASIVLYSTDPLWTGVPLRLTTGKALRQKRTSMTVDFGTDRVNRLQFRIQPDEGITLTLQVKKPGLTNDVESTTMNFGYETAFLQNGVVANAYERVLIEAIRGDHILFATDKEVLSSWRILQPLIDEWSKSAEDLVIYQSGSDGPDVTKLTAEK